TCAAAASASARRARCSPWASRASSPQRCRCRHWCKSSKTRSSAGSREERSHEAAQQRTGAVTRMSYDVERVRKEFPILAREVHGRPLVYLDNAATSHKPRAVLQALEEFYTRSNANIHRGVHLLSVEATEAYEAARRRIAAFIGAAAPEELVFVRGTT